MFAEIVKHTMKKLKLFLILIISCLTLQAQTRNKQYENYIKQYRDLAVEEMKKSQCFFACYEEESDRSCRQVPYGGLRGE